MSGELCKQYWLLLNAAYWTNVNKYFFFSTQHQLISCSQSATRPVVAVTSHNAMASYVPSLGRLQIHISTEGSELLSFS